MHGVDLFAGCGGLSLGLMQAGIQIDAALEHWQPAIEVYQNNFDHPVIDQDLRDIEASVKVIKRFRPDIVVGGPPCQDFSSAGLRNLNGGRADLTYSFADIVCRVKSKFFVMENVERIRKSHILQEVMDQFSAAKYGLTPVILDASYCGAPQARLRFFLVGRIGAKDNFLLGHLQRNLSRKAMTMRDYFGAKLNTEYYYRHPRNYSRRGIYSLDEPSATIRGVNRPIPPGYSLHPNDPDGISLDQVRPLTTGERALVQTFPDCFKFLGPKTAQEQMIGNAVPVALGTYVGRAILEYIRDGPIRALNEELLFSDYKLAIPERPLMPT